MTTNAKSKLGSWTLLVLLLASSLGCAGSGTNHQGSSEQSNGAAGQAGSAGGSAAAGTGAGSTAKSGPDDSKCMHEADLDYILTPRKLAVARTASGVRLRLADGKLFYATNTQLYSLPVSGGEPTLLFSDDTTTPSDAIGNFWIREKDIVVAFGIVSAGGGLRRVFSVPKDGGAATPLPSLRDASQPWSALFAGGVIVDQLQYGNFYTHDLDTGTDVDLGRNTRDQTPTFSTDGSVLILDDHELNTPIRFLSVPLAGGSATELRFSPPEKYPILIGAIDGSIYFSNSDAIKRMPLAGGTVETLADKLFYTYTGNVAVSDQGVALWGYPTIGGDQFQAAWMPSGSSKLTLSYCLANDIKVDNRAVLDGSVLYHSVSIGDGMIGIVRSALTGNGAAP